LKNTITTWLDSLISWSRAQHHVILMKPLTI